MPQPLRTLANNACQKKTHTRNERVYLKQWFSSACWAWPQDYHSHGEERLQLLKDLRDSKATRKDYSANLIRSAKDCTAKADKFGAPEKLNTWLLQGGRKKTPKGGHLAAIWCHYPRTEEGWFIVDLRGKKITNDACQHKCQQRRSLAR